LLGYSVKGSVPAADLQRAREQLDELAAPPTRQDVGEMLAVLYTLTKQRKEEQITLDLAIQTYAHRLMKYPRVVVRSVLEDWPNKSTWWPSWHELRVELDWKNKIGKVRDAVIEAQAYAERRVTA